MSATRLPTRLTGTQEQINSDLYDKINRLLTQQSTPVPSPTPPTPTPVTPSRGGSGGGGGGGSTSSGFANVPLLAVLPSNNPTTGAPYAVDGTLIEVNDQFWRYAGNPTYQWQLAGSATTILTDTHANRVLNYPAVNYPEALFLESDTLILLESNASIWRTVAGAVADTHANRLSTWPSVQYSVGTEFFESDRTVYYIVEDATGTVNTSGTAVTWVSGNHFINSGTGFNAAQWPLNTKITINGVVYLISSVSTDIALTLTTSAGVQSGVSYTVSSGRWVYFAGTCSTKQAGIPADLGENDATTVATVLVSGFLENVADYNHILQWNGSGYQWGPGEIGSAYFQDFAVAPGGTGWHVNNGATVNYLKSDGTLGSVTLPNSSGSPSYRKNGASYNATITAAMDPTVSGSTDTAVTGASVSAGGATVDNGTGAPQGVVTSVGFTDPGHAHGLSSVTASLPGDPVANYQAVTYFRQ